MSSGHGKWGGGGTLKAKLILCVRGTCKMPLTILGFIRRMFLRNLFSQYTNYQLNTMKGLVFQVKFKHFSSIFQVYFRAFPAPHSSGELYISVYLYAQNESLWQYDFDLIQGSAIDIGQYHRSI